MLTVTGQFKDGLEISGKKHHDFELRVPNTGDLLDAEDELTGDAVFKPQTFSATLAAIVMVRIGTFKGPFSSTMFRELSRRDWFELRDKLNDAEELGKPQSGDAGSN
ncbi:hypothetical protein [Burkholderia cenocepacia]|uniref:hypothetical protein n=1 Tax=Burkholderia cenocepacia TaxID=95486 RepID=UPI001BA31791|nr:hypothetical protein [Burkholderia cenocepacia]MBR8137185.1 hypothetical protein [Burkholderia cenocepacia]